MNKSLSVIAVTLLALSSSAGSLQARRIIDLNGTWEFDQTEAAFPPKKFTRSIPVPGLIFLAEPKIEQLEAYRAGTYQPRYNWYRKKFTVSADLKDSQAVLTLRKSKYITRAILNGIDLGQSVACYTPVEFIASAALRYGTENELLVCLDDRKRLPSQAAGSTDKEKVTYWPGIWDEVSLSFSGTFRISRALVLPSVSQAKATIKLQVRSFISAQVRYGDPMADSCTIQVAVYEKDSGKPAASASKQTVELKRDNLTEVSIDLPLAGAHLWFPDDPFLYRAVILLKGLDGAVSDSIVKNFGMRDFGREGKHFTLNGEKIFLRGTNITLHRFFEDPECAGLPWDRTWVKKLLSEIPQKLGWNAMRICVGIAPDFWYDIADESGLLLQNEWLYWQSHGWDEQIRAEYSDWVWSDGNHPSITIWDAINENWDSYIGNSLIPELKKLDPTRIWDAGYMTSEHMTLDEMDEPHPYMVFGHRTGFRDQPGDPPYPLGDLQYWPPSRQSFLNSGAAQLVNEYGWVWLWRDGRPAKLTIGVYAYYLGEQATPEERREFQAYWVQLQTEWLRAERSFAGVLAFCYLTNNYGFTGDWFTGPVAGLNPGPALKWFKHCFAPAAVFIDLQDSRYNRDVPPLEPGAWLSFDLAGVNDLKSEVKGRVKLRILDSAGQETVSRELSLTLPGYLKKYTPVAIQLPQQPGGYLLLAEFTPEGGADTGPVISRRYLKVGNAASYKFYDYQPGW